MKNFLFLICAISFLTVGLVSTACAHIEGQQESSISIELDSNLDGNDTTVAPCDDVHCHNHIVSIYFSSNVAHYSANKLQILSSEDTVTPPVYSLKRPPRT